MVLLTALFKLHTGSIIGPFKGTIGMYMASWGTPLDPSKLINLIIFDPFLVCGALGNILTAIVSNYHFGKRLGARDMTIFGFHFGGHNIQR